MSEFSLLHRLSEYTDQQITSNLHQIIHLGIYIDTLHKKIEGVQDIEVDKYLIKEFRRIVGELIELETAQQGFTMFILLRRLKKSLEQKYQVEL